MGKWDVIEHKKIIADEPRASRTPDLHSLGATIDSSKDNPTLEELSNDPLTTILRAANKYIANPVQNTANSINHSLSDIPSAISDAVHSKDVSGSLENQWRAGKDLLAGVTSPFSIATAPIAPLLDKAITPTENILNATGNAPKVNVEDNNESSLGYLGKLLSTPKGVSSGSKFTDELSSLAAPLLVLPEMGGEARTGVGVEKALTKNPLDEPIGASPVAHEIARLHNENGGSTYSLHNGDLVGKNQHAVSIFPERSEQVQGELTPEHIQNYIENNRDLLSNPKTSVGTWKSPDGVNYLDVSATTPSKNHAVELGRKYNQKSVFDLAKMQEVPTYGTGEVLPNLPPEAERLNDIPDTPPTEPFIGKHFSQSPVKEGVLLGDRRGSSGVGAEKNRLNLGSGAAPGVYVYRDNGRPEPLISGRGNVSKVKGNFALAELEHNPLWNDTLAKHTDAYKQKGFNDTQSRLMAINDAEHELRDNGFDGYYSVHHPDSVFLFGDQKIVTPELANKSFNSSAELDNTARPSEWDVQSHEPVNASVETPAEKRPEEAPTELARNRPKKKK